MEFDDKVIQISASCCLCCFSITALCFSSSLQWSSYWNTKIGFCCMLPDPQSFLKSKIILLTKKFPCAQLQILRKLQVIKVWPVSYHFEIENFKILQILKRIFWLFSGSWHQKSKISRILERTMRSHAHHSNGNQKTVILWCCTSESIEK